MQFLLQEIGERPTDIQQAFANIECLSAEDYLEVVKADFKEKDGEIFVAEIASKDTAYIKYFSKPFNKVIHHYATPVNKIVDYEKN